MLIERLSDSELLFLTYYAETAIQTLEKEQEKIRTILNQLSDPDPLTEAVLALSADDLKSTSHRPQSVTQPITVNP